MPTSEPLGRLCLGKLLEELGADGLTVEEENEIWARDEVWVLFKNAVAGALWELHAERRVPWER